MTTKFTSRRFFWSVFIALLVACGTLPPESTPTATQATTHTGKATLAPSLTPVSPTPTILPTTSTPTSSFPVSSASDGLRMAYVVDGNIYFQNGSNPPLQLTNSGEDWRLVFFTDDGEKIFFFRGVTGQDLYSINVDGSEEQVLVTSNLLLTFGSEYDESTTLCDLILVPHIHHLLFRTCSHPDENTIVYQSDLFLVDANNNQVKNLFPREQGGTVYVSPDGSMLAIDRHNYIDIVGIDGKMIYPKLATYTLSEPVPLASHVYWISDSRELIVALPINTYHETGLIPKYAIWRYSLDTGTGVQISFDPPPMGHDPARVSPDGNRIIYNDYEEGLFYVGNLREGQAQLYEPSGAYVFSDWNLASTHFIYENAAGRDLYVGSFNSPPVLIGRGRFIGWIDANRYLYSIDKSLVVGDIGGESKPILMGTAQSSFSYYPEGFIFRYQPLQN